MNKSAKFFVILLTVFAVSTSPLYATTLPREIYYSILIQSTRVPQPHRERLLG